MKCETNYLWLGRLLRLRDYPDLCWHQTHFLSYFLQQEKRKHSHTQHNTQKFLCILFFQYIYEFQIKRIFDWTQIGRFFSSFVLQLIISSFVFCSAYRFWWLTNCVGDQYQNGKLKNLILQIHSDRCRTRHRNINIIIIVNRMTDGDGILEPFSIICIKRHGRMIEIHRMTFGLGWFKWGW